MKLEFDSNLPGLLEEVLNNQTCTVLRTPINITRNLLAELAQIAIELDNPKLHIMMLRLGLYDMPNKKRVVMIKKLKNELSAKGGKHE